MCHRVEALAETLSRRQCFPRHSRTCRKTAKPQLILTVRSPQPEVIVADLAEGDLAEGDIDKRDTD